MKPHIKSNSRESLYFLALVPEEDLCTEITNLKQEAFDRFGSKASLNSPPHITLHMPFRWKESREVLLLDILRHIPFDEWPIKIHLDGFGFFPPRVVFLRVAADRTLFNLQQIIVKRLRSDLHILNADYKNRPFHPHLTIAFRDLKKAVFPEAQDFYEQKSFNRSFSAKDFCLLKHNGKTWEVFERMN